MISHIADMRRELFASLLTKRYDIDYTLLTQVEEDFGSASRDLYRTASSWLRFVIQFKLQSVVSATVLALVAAFVLLVGGRRYLGGLFEPDPTVENPSYLSRLSVAFWSTLIPTVALGTFFAVTYALYDYFNVLRGDIADDDDDAVYRHLHHLLRAPAGPGGAVARLPHWRLIAVETRAARLLIWLVSADRDLHRIDPSSTPSSRCWVRRFATVAESLAPVLTGLR